MKCGYFLSFICSLLVTLSLAAGYIIMTTPIPEKPKEEPIEIEVYKSAKAMETLFTTDHIEESTSTGVIANFTHFMNNVTTRNYAMKLAKNMSLFNLSLDRVDLINVRCKELAFKRYIFYFVSLARELIVHGGSSIFECRMPTLIRTMVECRDPQVDKLCMYLMVTAINFEKGGLCFQGSAKSLYELASRYPYGTIDWEVLSIMAIWSDRIDKLAEIDREGMCQQVDRMIKNRAFWSEDVKTHMAWLYKNIKCHEFDKLDIDTLMKDPNVIEFLKSTEEIQSDL